MAATYEEIVTYLVDASDAQSDYGQKVAKMHRLGRHELKIEMIKLILLSYYVRMLEKYFDCDDYEVDNFFTTEQAKDIMERINGICKTFIYLKI